MDAQRDAPLAPMIYATTEPQTLQRIQAQYGDKASSERVEQLFAALAAALKAKGFTRFNCGRRGNVEHCGADPGG
ncbi:hypothetical protein ACMFFM_23290 [Klebsiella pneumoniae]